MVEVDVSGTKVYSGVGLQDPPVVRWVMVHTCMSALGGCEDSLPGDYQGSNVRTFKVLLRLDVSQ